MRKFFFLAFAAVLLLGVGPCGGGSGGGDDDSGGNADDDSGSNDDDASGDDDTYGNLTWQNPPSSDYMTWEEAKAYCDNLSFDGHDDWRLPKISELRSLIRGCDATMTGGACNATDDCLDFSCDNHPCCGCDQLAGPGSGGAYWPDGMSGAIDHYWSSSPVADGGSPAWGVIFGFGRVYGGDTDCSHSDDVGPDGYARCVRP